MAPRRRPILLIFGLKVAAAPARLAGSASRDLMMLGMELGRGEGSRTASWPLVERQDYSMWGRTDALVRHPHDGGVRLGGEGALQRVAELGIDAVVSLCRLATLDVRGV